MIKITIEQIVTTYPIVKENRLKRKTPTPVKGRTSEYDKQETVQFAEEYEVVEVTKEVTTRATLLNQEITDDSKFNLPAVIRAINNFDEPLLVAPGSFIEVNKKP